MSNRLDNKNPISMKAWGKDHWSTLLYLETRVVDHDGHLAPPQMRSGSEYPTRLKAGKVSHHDDWDCVVDMIEQGLVTLNAGPHAFDPTRTSGRQLHRFCADGALVGLTDLGWKVAHQLRRHQAETRRSGTFEPEVTP